MTENDRLLKLKEEIEKLQAPNAPKEALGLVDKRQVLNVIDRFLKKNV